LKLEPHLSVLAGTSPQFPLAAGWCDLCAFIHSLAGCTTSSRSRYGLGLMGLSGDELVSP
jgi:hypothetical protein